MDNQNKPLGLQEQIHTYKQKLALAEQNYQSAKRACRVSEAKHFKTQIEYLHQQILELEQKKLYK